MTANSYSERVSIEYVQHAGRWRFAPVDRRPGRTSVGTISCARLEPWRLSHV